MFTDVLILAGGSGERLWPVSDAQKPKQFMALADGESFLQAAILRAAALDIEGNICIVTRRDWADLVVADVRVLADTYAMGELLSKVIVMCEPCGKNTAPAIAWTARYLLSLKRTKPVNILMMASDHVIKPLDSFIADARTAAWHSERNNLVSFAIPPASAATGYGYIKAAAPMHCPFENATPAFKIETFREKPDAATAKSYLEDGHYYWNSGIYAFRADFFLSELAVHNGETAKAFASLGSMAAGAATGASGPATIELRDGIRVMTAYEGLDEAYAASPSISIDYAVSEKCASSVTVRASFLWDDVGTWDSLAKYSDRLPRDTVSVESRNCYVNSDIPVALCGVEDLVVVIKNGKALVSRKGETNLVKDALALLKLKGIS